MILWAGTFLPSSTVIRGCFWLSRTLHPFILEFPAPLLESPWSSQPAKPTGIMKSEDQYLEGPTPLCSLHQSFPMRNIPDVLGHTSYQAKPASALVTNDRICCLEVPRWGKCPMFWPTLRDWSLLQNQCFIPVPPPLSWACYAFGCWISVWFVVLIPLQSVFVGGG